MNAPSLIRVKASLHVLLGVYKTSDEQVFLHTIIFSYHLRTPPTKTLNPEKVFIYLKWGFWGEY